MNTFDTVWAAYEPGDGAPWDLSRVVHLHRRAGFGATWDEIRRDLADGPRASVDRLDIRAGESYAQSLRRFFHMRERRQR